MCRAHSHSQGSWIDCGQSVLRRPSWATRRASRFLAPVGLCRWKFFALARNFATKHFPALQFTELSCPLLPFDVEGGRTDGKGGRQKYGLRMVQSMKYIYIYTYYTWPWPSSNKLFPSPKFTDSLPFHEEFVRSVELLQGTTQIAALPKTAAFHAPREAPETYTLASTLNIKTP